MAQSLITKTPAIIAVGAMVLLLSTAPTAGGQNLIVNGDFEAGNTGFTSEYTYIASTTKTTGDCIADSMWDPFTYAIGTNPNAYHTGWNTFGDHTSGSGNMMIVNAAAPDRCPGRTADDVVWEQTVSVNSGSQYQFSYWVALSIVRAAPLLQVNVNGNEIGHFDAASPASGITTWGSWTQVTHTWTATSNSATITIVDLRPVYDGDDYTLDDIALVSLTIPVTINVHPYSDPNPLNLKSGGTTPVAILGSATFDVNQINIGSLTLANATVKVVGKSDRQLCSIADIGSYDPNEFDKLGPADGIDDLVCHFMTSEIAPVTDGDYFTVKVMGELINGTEFEGSDIVKIVKE